MNTKNNQNTLASRLKAARLNADFTQEELAEKIGVSRIAVAEWERGNKEPKLFNLILICKVLHISSDDLLGICATPATPLALSEKAITYLQSFIEEIKKQ